MRNKILQCYEEGKLNVDAVESLYIIFTENIHQEANKIYDSQIKKEDKEEEK